VGGSGIGVSVDNGVGVNVGRSGRVGVGKGVGSPAGPHAAASKESITAMLRIDQMARWTDMRSPFSSGIAGAAQPCGARLASRAIVSQAQAESYFVCRLGHQDRLFG
jgi:hypothetical protein